MPADWGRAGLAVSAIVPTIGRPESLERLLRSLSVQTRKPGEIVVADGGDDPAVRDLVQRPEWKSEGLDVRWVPVRPPNAVRQREAAIAASTGGLLLLLDDDVELERDCIEQLLGALDSRPDAVAAMADFNNQAWSIPTLVWRIYLRVVHGLADGQWQGRVVGPLLRFGYHPAPAEVSPMQWMGAGNSLVYRAAFEQAGGFSDFFLSRCTMNEDVDLGLKLNRLGAILFCPKARLAHFHDPGGRLTPAEVAEDDVHNRFMVLHSTVGRSKLASLWLLIVFVSVESLSNFAGSLRTGRVGNKLRVLGGRLRGLARIARLSFAGRP